MSTTADLAIFVKLISHCFKTISGHEPVFGSTSIEVGMPALYAYSGFINVEGPLNGWVSLSIPGLLADRLLDFFNEPAHDDEYRLDLAGEIASTVVANAREHFGQRLLVHPALVTRDDALPSPLQQPPMTLRLPFVWLDYQALLLVGINFK